MAWCIADQENTDVVLLLFQSIKDHSPSTEIRVLMSDDGKLTIYTKKLMLHSIITCFLQLDNIYVNAAKKVFGDSVKHLLCRWHVDQ